MLLKHCYSFCTKKTIWKSRNFIPSSKWPLIQASKTLSVDDLFLVIDGFLVYGLEHL